MPETGNARQQARLSFACNLLDFSSFFQLRVTIGVTMTYSWAQWCLTRTRLLGGHAPASQATADTAGITKQPSAFSVLLPGKRLGCWSVQAPARDTDLSQNLDYGTECMQMSARRCS